MDSQESIMEVGGSYIDNHSVVVNMSLPITPQPHQFTGNILQQIEQWEQRLSRYNLNPPPVLFHNHIPERSQSSCSFVNDLANEYNTASSMTNKLLLQHGIVQTMRKMSRTEDTIKFSDTLKKRRSRSADSRFSHSTSVPNDVYQKLTVDLSTAPSTSRASRENMRFLSVPAPEPPVKLLVNGKGVDI